MPDPYAITVARPPYVADGPLAVLELLGPEGESLGRAYAVPGPGTEIGRADGAGVPVVSDLASRHHARIVACGNAHMIIDLQSKNGTAVNGRRVTEAVLREGDLVHIGDVVFRYLLDDGGWVSPLRNGPDGARPLKRAESGSDAQPRPLSRPSPRHKAQRRAAR
jgi:predicted component of type VI protein secretion system